ncbi:hypothetical protein SORBI_3008G127250 [Sorghum bicolor]|uniref:Uncharacterized protein n=1 Tax=Sorghum bicolor TaxID=4558 RepID=A0A1Z5R6B2_SORBI|nr:hypothetical protein SORBI_3008G127250 [Sorghum bicolor]
MLKVQRGRMLCLQPTPSALGLLMPQREWGLHRLKKLTAATCIRGVAQKENEISARFSDLRVFKSIRSFI